MSKIVISLVHIGYWQSPWLEKSDKSLFFCIVFAKWYSFCHMHIKKRPAHLSFKKSLPPSHLGNVQTSLTLLSVCRRLSIVERLGGFWCCKGKAFIWIVQGFWGKSAEMEVVFTGCWVSPCCFCAVKVRFCSFNMKGFSPRFFCPRISLIYTNNKAFR